MSIIQGVVFGGSSVVGDMDSCVEKQELRFEIKELREEMQNLQDKFKNLEKYLRMPNQRRTYVTEFVEILGNKINRDPKTMFFAIIAFICILNNDQIFRIFRQVVTAMLLVGLIIGIVLLEKEQKTDEEHIGSVIALERNEEEKVDENKKTDEEEEKDSVGIVISIDLGTTYSRVGIYRDGQIEIIKNDQGNVLTPSCVAFTADGKRLIGDAAISHLTINPENTIYNVKDLMGREWTDQIVQDSIKKFPFKVIENNGKPYIKVQINQKEKIFAPEDISALIIGEMKRIAENHLGHEVTHAVISIPANFNDAQRRATKEASTRAGLEVWQLINAPSAAAIMYGGLDKQKRKRNVLVCDLGGGNFDVTLVTIDNDKYEVVSTHGNAQIGGETFDQHTLDHFIEQLSKKNKGKDIRKDKITVQRLRIDVEKAKRAFSTSEEVKIEIKCFFEGEDFEEKLTRVQFEKLNKSSFENTIKSIENVLDEAKKKYDINKKDIDEYILVGGSSRIPLVRQIIENFFDGNKKPYQFDGSDKAVIAGAGILSSNEEIEHIVLIDVNPLTLGINVLGDEMAAVIPRNTKIPTKRDEIFTTTRDNQVEALIEVYEGECRMTKDNQFLGGFRLEKIPPAPRGVPKIEVTFELDINGILRVSAKDMGTGNQKHITIDYKQKKLAP